ncbi:AAA family ATPase [uncultured Maritimibacter sp.]|uniref:AAA family ATPase n=1 Tax=uncultured Maritimibacter sp. TaxID=991866 RepID=UPI0025937FBF|nr:AAA family ATPase [uncultured Maritimibacter sp.]
MNAHFTLSNDERAKVRKVITSHDDWKSYREIHGITASDLTSARCIEVCDALGIDVQAAKDGIEQRRNVPERNAAYAAARDLLDETPETPDAAAAAPKKDQAAVPAATPTQDPLVALEALRALLGGTVDANQVKAIVAEELAPVLETIGKPALRVVDPDGAALGVDLPPMRHEMTDTLLAAVAARGADGFRLNAWITGPAGSGKTTGARLVAEALGLEFGFHGAMTMAHELTGFVDAGGTYHETVFVRLFRDGGLCLLDEVDAGSSEALLALNAALANGTMSLPNGEIIHRHADFACVGAANTWGMGATADYIGRARIDAAFLDRFGARIHWDYDATLETAMCGNEKWAKRVQKARKKAAKAGLKVLITPRASMAGAALIAGGMAEGDAARVTYLAGLTPEQVAQVEG